MDQNVFDADVVRSPTWLEIRCSPKAEVDITRCFTLGWQECQPACVIQEENPTTFSPRDEFATT
jgi:hypothetical protein